MTGVVRSQEGWAPCHRPREQSGRPSDVQTVAARPSRSGPGCTPQDVTPVPTVAQVARAETADSPVSAVIAAEVT